MAVQYEDRLLDINYVETQVKCLNDIRKGLYTYHIRYSDNHLTMGSNSIYVVFTHKLASGYEVFGCTLRISDHKARQWEQDELMVDTKSVLTSKKKQALIKALEKTLQKSKKRIQYFVLNKLDNITPKVEH